MRYTYDEKTQAVYIYVLSGTKYAKTIPFGDYVNVDIDEHGQVTGIEILNVPEIGVDKQE
jgi:uncharacterized protein YuzE